YKLEKYEIIEFESVKIFRKKEEPNTFAFIRNEKVKFLKFPFNYLELENYFKKDTKSFSNFLSKVIPVIINSNKQLEISTKIELLNYIKYSETLHWHIDINLSPLLIFALNNLIDDGVTNYEIFAWIKRGRNYSNREFVTSDLFNKDD